MYIINQVTADPLQIQQITLPDGSLLTMTLYFVPMQYGWFITILTWGTFILNGLRVCNSPNMLYQFSNQLTFGLACFSTNNREPMLQQDFSSGNSILYILDNAEVQEYVTYINGSN